MQIDPGMVAQVKSLIFYLFFGGVTVDMQIDPGTVVAFTATAAPSEVQVNFQKSQGNCR
jgi:hypothetical protein